MPKASPTRCGTSTAGRCSPQTCLPSGLRCRSASAASSRRWTWVAAEVALIPLLQQREHNMRLSLLLATAFALFTSPLRAAEPEKQKFDLRSDILVAPVPVAESDTGAYEFYPTAQLDKAGTGAGTLVLTPSAPAFDEFG